MDDGLVKDGVDGGVFYFFLVGSIMWFIGWVSIFIYSRYVMINDVSWGD